MKTLILIFGQVRTFSECFFSIYKNIILENHPCDIILSIDGKYSDLPHDIVKKLDLYLIDIYVTHKKDDEIRRDHHRIEFSLIKKGLERVVNIDDYTFLLKVRTDVYIKEKINIKEIYGLCSPFVFQKKWTEFCKKIKEKKDLIQKWILTGGLSFFIPYQIDQKPISPWSLSNTIEWNSELWTYIQNQNQNQLFILRDIFKKHKIMYLIGSTWIHFGYAKDVYDLSIELEDKHTMMNWKDKKDDDILEWIDHKNEKRSLVQSEWRNITDDQIRLIHHLKNIFLIDLVNKHDYIESFDASHSLFLNKKNPNLCAFLVRHHQI